MLNGFYQSEISMPLDWAQGQWVCLYLFSDEAANLKGFGAYAPGVGAEYFETTNGGSYDMMQHQASDKMRIGSNNLDNEPVSNLRKVLIFKGTAIHAASTDTRQDLLNSVDCPRLIVSASPACSETYFYYKMTSGFLTSADQSVTDSSGSNADAINGSNPTADSNDCTAQADSIDFNGSCFLKKSGLSLSSRGFSLEVEVKVSAAGSTMTILQEVNENKLILQIQPTNSRVTLFVDGNTNVASGCSGLQSGNWVTIGVSIIADDTEHEVIMACDQVVLKEGGSQKKLDFSLSSFRIGDGFTGKMREFKLYHLPLGKETLTKATTIGQSCASGFYYDSGTAQCIACPALCTVCSSGVSGSCLACVTNAVESGGVCGCSAQSYESSGSCLLCDALCDGCTGPGNTACIACASLNYLVEGTNTCVSACSNFAPNYFLDASVCKPCHASCATCSAQFEYNCLSCAPGSTELTASPLKDPKHCASPCPSGEYHDGQSCVCRFHSFLACSANCEVCSGSAPSDCTVCQSGFFFLSSTSECVASCPPGFFSNSATRACQACTDLNCLECPTDKSICTACSTVSSYYLNGTACSYCAAPNHTGHDSCSACTLEGYSISDSGECEEQCGDGKLLSPHHQCDDGNMNDGDGCSSSCLIENGYLCERSSSSSSDVCSQIRQLGIQTLTINEDSLLVVVSLNQPVLFSDLSIQQFSFTLTSLSEEDLQISLSSPVQGLSDSFYLQLTPQVSIPDNATLSFTLHPLTSITSVKPSITVPHSIESPLLNLPAFELSSSSFEEAAGPVGQAMSWATILLLVGMSVSQCVLQSSMESMWVLISTDQLISYIPLMSISFPSNMLLLFNILTFFNGEVYLFLLAYDYSVGLFFDFPGETFPYNDRFALLGYDSVKLMDNSGVFISLWIFLLFFVLILLLARKICRCRCCIRTSSRLLRCVIWGPILRTFILTFLQLGFCAFINIVFISFESAPDSLSSLLSLTVLFTLLVLPFLLLHILSAIPSTLSDSLYKQKFGEVYKDLDYLDNYASGFYYPLFLLHRFFFIAVVFGAFFSGRLQCCLMIVATSLFLVLLVKWKPFLLRLDRFLNILAAVVLVILYCFCLVFSFLDQSSFKSERHVIGYVFIGLVIGFFVLTCLLVFVSKVMLCVNKSKKKSQIEPQLRTTESGLILSEGRQPTFLPRMSIFRPIVKPSLEADCPGNYKEELSALDDVSVKEVGKAKQPPQSIF